MANAERARQSGYSEAASQIHRRLPVVFAGAGLVLGLLYAFVLPPLQVADEMMHFARVYSVSQGVCIASPDIDIPKSLAELDATFPHWLEKHRKISIGDLRASLKTPLDEGVMAGNGRQRSLDGFINQNLYPCVPYVPAAVAMNVGRRLELSPLALLYLTRVTHLVVYLVLTYFALRLLPDFRWILFCVALMPMAMHQAASASADSGSFAVTFLLCAYIFRLAFAEPPEAIGARQYVALGLLIATVALSKSMLAVIALPLLIPAASFRSSQHRWRAIAAYALLAVLCVGVWPLLNQANTQRLAEERITRPRVGLPAVDVPGNEKFLWEHPLAATSVFVRSITDLDYIASSSAQMVGRLGWLSVRLPNWLVWLYILLLIAAAATQTLNTKLTWLARGLVALFVVVGTANTLAAGWVLETPKVVLSVPANWERFRVYTQGRYWIPLVFPALILLTTAKPRLNPRLFAGIAATVILVATAVAIAAIVAMYYN